MRVMEHQDPENFSAFDSSDGNGFVAPDERTDGFFLLAKLMPIIPEDIAVMGIDKRPKIMNFVPFRMRIAFLTRSYY
ncbi:hypothetical protein CEXT_74441 [Caerostris extrusa]|uniref:Uncharacterized protein n=1 Tax=Caerostris extrusa TaxID=172846 RepID=A0AAV4VED1_CAEEX|nr:hypothetical protein CEXT_74441 [Caerostris extrusa]